MHHNRADSAAVHRVLLGDEPRFVPEGRVLSGLHQALTGFRGAEIFDFGDQIIVGGRAFFIENQDPVAASESSTDSTLIREP